jgi:hypothetical protein
MSFAACSKHDHSALQQPLHHHRLQDGLCFNCRLQVSADGAQYVLQHSSSPSKVSLATLDAWGAAPPEGNAQQLAEYEGLVSLPFDALGDPGWNMQVRH